MRLANIVSAVTFDCANPQRVARFWSALNRPHLDELHDFRGSSDIHCVIIGRAVTELDVPQITAGVVALVRILAGVKLRFPPVGLLVFLAGSRTGPRAALWRLVRYRPGVVPMMLVKAAMKLLGLAHPQA